MILESSTELNDRSLLTAITSAQSAMVEGSDPRQVFEVLLDNLLILTHSEYGFIGEILQSNKGQPYLKTYAITDISWNEETKKFFEENVSRGLDFYNLDTLFGAVIKTGKPVISNDPAHDDRSAGIPKGHPPLNSFLGLPFYGGAGLVGMVGIANRPNGYNEEVKQFLNPFLSTCSSIILALRHQQSYKDTLTALTSSEQALRKEKGQLRAILDSALDGIIVIDENAIIQSVNPSAERLFGYGEEELVGKNVSKLMPEPYMVKHDGFVRSYLNTGIAKVIGKKGRELAGVRKDGSVFPLDLAVGEVKLGGKRLFTGILRDITTRKEAKQQIENALQELKQSHDDLLAILNSLRINTLIVDSQGDVSFISEGCGEIAGINTTAAVGKPWSNVLPVDLNSKQELQKMMRNPPQERRRITITLDGARGKSYWVECEIKNFPRNPQERIIFLYDVTEVHNLKQQLERTSFSAMIGNDKKMLELYQSIKEVAQGDWTVLIEGETGVGKELVARSIHSASQRNRGPFIAVNCAGLTESLITSQLFGHRKGAFTGAVADQAGVFEASNGGTLFLDEIGDIPLNTQTALLRVLQEREITRIGDTTPRKIDVRVIVATHRDLNVQVNQGLFRADLLYRIRVARLNVPPLRERKADIPLLANSFLAESRVTTGKIVSEISDEVLKLLFNYAWPGNVRELKNVIEYAVIHSRSAQLKREDMPPEILNAKTTSAENNSLIPGNDEKARIIAALKTANGNRTRAAKMLGMSRATFYRKLDEYQLNPKEIVVE